MKQENYVTFEVAKLLKEKGYNHYQKQHYFAEDIHACNGLFNIKGGLLTYMFALSDEYEDKKIYAPSLWNVQKWLREERNISVEPYANASGWNFEICKTDGTSIKDSHYLEFNEELMNGGGAYASYEVSLNEGIKEALKMI